MIMKTKNYLLIAISFLFIANTYGQIGANAGNINKTFGIDPSEKVTYTTAVASCDTIDSFDVQTVPTGVTWDGNYFWVADTSFIYKISATGVFIDSIANPTPTTISMRGGGLAFDGSNLWYVEEDTAQLYKINPATGAVVQQYNLPSYGQSDPNGFGLTWDGQNLWHSQYDSPMIYKINSANGQAIDSLTLTGDIMGIAWLNGSLFGTSPNSQMIYRINSNTGAFEDSTAWCVPFALGLTSDGSNLWSVSGTESIFGVPTGGKHRNYKMISNITSSTDEISAEVYGGQFSLNNFPNPFNFDTKIVVSLPKNGVAELKIYDSSGRKVSTLLNEFRDQGIYEFLFDASSLKPGLYLYTVRMDGIYITKKMTLFR